MQNFSMIEKDLLAEKSRELKNKVLFSQVVIEPVGAKVGHAVVKVVRKIKQNNK